MRTSPNIIITGTPGVGKTTHCELLAQRTGLRHLSVNEVVKDKGCHEGWDEEYSCWIVDEDRVRPYPLPFLPASPPALTEPSSSTRWKTTRRMAAS